MNVISLIGTALPYPVCLSHMNQGAPGKYFSLLWFNLEVSVLGCLEMVVLRTPLPIIQWKLPLGGCNYPSTLSACLSL